MGSNGTALHVAMRMAAFLVMITLPSVSYAQASIAGGGVQFNLIPREGGNRFSGTPCKASGSPARCQLQCAQCSRSALSRPAAVGRRRQRDRQSDRARRAVWRSIESARLPAVEALCVWLLSDAHQRGPVQRAQRRAGDPGEQQLRGWRTPLVVQQARVAKLSVQLDF